MEKRRMKRKSKMLPIPSSVFIQKKLTREDLKSLKKKYLLPKSVVEFLEDQYFSSPGDILKLAAQSKTLEPIDVFKLLISPSYDDAEYFLFEDRVSSQNLDVKETDLSIRLWTLTSGQRRIVISSVDTEIISVNIDETNEVEPSTIKIGGYWFWEWSRLPKGTKKKILRRLLYPKIMKGVSTLARLEYESQPVVNDQPVPIRKINQIMSFFYSTTGALVNDTVAPGGVGIGIYEPGQPMPHDDYESNSCTGSPDWPFDECCVAHDYCYIEQEKARGCDECARFECDLDFLECMLSIAGTNPLLIEMAFVYFIAVRTFGAFFFDYCDFPGVSVAVAGALGLGAVGVVTAGALMTALEGALGIVFTAVGLAAIVAAMILTAKIICGICEIVDNMVEKCEADRIVEEERCKRRKKKCKRKRKWWKKLWCKIKYFWHCTIKRYVKRGLCWLVKQGYKIVC